MKKKLLSVLLALVLALSLCLVTAVPVSAAGTPAIDGTVSAGEWDGAVSIPVASGMGTVKLLASTDYLYVLFEVGDSTDAREGENLHGNDQTSININPTHGGLWGKPCDIVFQTGADPDAFTTPIPDKLGSSGIIDGYQTEWVIDGEQLDLPGDLETMTLYDYGTSTRISEWKVPLATIGPSQGGTLKVGGAIDVGDGSSYVYPVGLAWGDAATYMDYSFIVENETTGLYYQTIQAGIDAAVAGDTINVAAGTYQENVVVDRSLTLQGEDRGTTEIKFGYDFYPSTSPLTISADGVIVSGFTIRSGAYIEPAWTIVVEGNSTLLTDIYVIKDPLLWANNTPKISGAAIFLAPGLDGFNFTDSVVESEWNGIYMREGSSDILVKKVDFTYPGEYAVFLKTITGATIEENTFTCTADQYGVIVTRGSDEIEIVGNQFAGSGSQEDSHIGIPLQAWEGFTMGDVTILRNEISKFQTGILVEDVDTSGISIHYNNITGNTCGVKYIGNPNTLDATNNWWGNPNGPGADAFAEYPAGDTVSENVDFSPWLDAAYPDGVPTILLSLKAGWNLISLPLIPEDSSIETVLTGTELTLIKVAYYTGDPEGLEGGWLYYGGDPKISDLTQMQDGKGYWIDVSTAGPLTIHGYEVCAPPPAVPPSYNLVEGWNLIGFKSLATDTDVTTYLGPAVIGTMEAMYGYNATTGLYEIIKSADPLVPGDGYWLAVSADGTIYP